MNNSTLPRFTFATWLPGALVSGLLTLAPTATGNEDIFDYYFHDLDLPAASQDDFRRLGNLLSYQTLEEALVLAEDIIDNNESLRHNDPVLYGKLLANLGMVLNHGEYHENAVLAFDNALEVLQTSLPQFSPQLINVLVAKGLTLASLDRPDDALEALRWAQHITHRDDGVYTQNQLPIIDRLFEISYHKGEVLTADQQQFFSLRVSERAFGDDSEDLLPTLLRLGNYFANRANSSALYTSNDMRYHRELLFRRSLELFDRAIKIIEDNYGPNDIRLVEPLRGISRTRFMQRTNKKSKLALERALFVVESNPTTDLSDRVDGMIQLGDLYTLTSDSRAEEMYLKAWNLMLETPENEGLAIRIFGTPTRLYPRIPRVIYLARRPDAASDDNAELFIDAEYTVQADGTVGNVRLLDKNVPNDQVRRLRTTLAGSRFRPRIVEGELVETENLLIRQTFRVANATESSE